MLDTPVKTDAAPISQEPMDFETKKGTIAQQLQAKIKAAATDEVIGDVDQVKIDALPKEEEVKVEPKQDDDDFTNRMALLARRERMIIEQQNKLKEREAIVLQNEELRQRAKKDPRAALKELGWEYDQLINAELNDFKPKEVNQVEELTSTVKTLMAEIEALKTKPKEELDAFKEEQFQNGVQQYKRGVEQYVNQNEAKYKYIKKMNGLDTVVEVAKEIFKNEKYEPTFEEACDRVETYIRTETKKYKDLLLSLETDEPIDHNESIDSSKNGQQQNIKLNSQAPRTLSSNSFSDNGTQIQNPNRSFDERKKRAAMIVEKLRQAKA